MRHEINWLTWGCLPSFHYDCVQWQTRFHFPVFVLHIVTEYFISNYFKRFAAVAFPIFDFTTRKRKKNSGRQTSKQTNEKAAVFWRNVKSKNAITRMFRTKSKNLPSWFGRWAEQRTVSRAPCVAHAWPLCLPNWVSLFPSIGSGIKPFVAHCWGNDTQPAFVGLSGAFSICRVHVAIPFVWSLGGFSPAAPWDPQVFPIYCIRTTSSQILSLLPNYIARGFVNSV